MNRIHTKSINFWVLVVSCLALCALSLRNHSKQHNDPNHITIGILQTITHPALDRTREGFMDELTRHLGKQTTFIVQNAEGSMTTAQTIAQSFHHNATISAIATIGTLATQAVCKIEKQKPIIFSAVTDPIALGIMQSATNVCGATDAVDIIMAAKTISTLCPHIKRMALLFNPAEANSTSLIPKMDAALHQTGIATLLVGVQSEAEITTAVTMALGQTDALWIPTDNTLANAMNIIGRLALKAKKPLFICDNLLICDGILAATGGVDYTQCGIQAGTLAGKILKNKISPAQLGIVNSLSTTIVMHKPTCDILDIQIPQSLQTHITWIHKQMRAQ